MLIVSDAILMSCATTDSISRDSEYQEINTLESTVMNKVNDRSVDTEQTDETHERAQGYSDNGSPCSDPDRVNTLLFKCA